MRRAKWLMLALGVGLLTGCDGGGGDSEPEILTGTLQAGAAQGVQFSSATQSGITDANGTFFYLSGENVTFSIGKVELGSAPGAPEVSLFRLAGLTPPSTELHLRRELNRALTTNTALSRAINMARFLLALDVDGNPGNGIDVRGRDATLAPGPDFDAPLQAFPEMLAAAAPNLNNNISAARSVLHLYRWAGVQIRANYAVRQFSDLNGDGVDDTRLEGIYGANGEYQTTQFDAGADGSLEGSTEFATDALGRSLSVLTTRDETGDNIPDYTFTNQYTFDARGNLTLYSALEQGGALPVYHYEHSSSFTHDDRGRTLTATHDTRDPWGQVLVMRSSIVYTRDSRGNATRVVTVVGGEVGPVFYRLIEDNIFDSDGRATSSVATYDQDADGQLDSRRTTLSSYDLLGRPGSTLSETDSNADGVIDQRERVRYTFDRAGNQQRVQVEREGNVPGVVTFRSDQRSTHDRDHRLLSNVITTDADGDGDDDESNEDLYTYDSNGMMTAAESLNRDLASGTLAYRARRDVTYSAEGAPLHELYVLDFDGDGDLEVQESSRIEYAFSEDALPRILTNFLPYPSDAASAVAAGF